MILKYIEENSTIGNDIVKVDTFINQQIDPVIMDAFANEFALYFRNKKIDRVITIEAGGIAPAVLTALKLNVPLTVIKKESSKLMTDVYTSTVHSFTKNKTYDLCVNKHNLDQNESVLFIDDFLANGHAFMAAKDIVEQSGSNITSVGILIEKSFQSGRQKIEALEIDILSVARITKLSEENGIEWFEEDC